jgi:hypothetical protein
VKRDFPIPDEIDERLREWAHFFRDRQRLETCRSAERHYKAHSDDFAAEGWGDMETAPRTQPARSYGLQRALQTDDEIRKLDVKYRWALTFGFCYPSLPRFVVLRLMKKWTGAKVTWNQYLESVDIARFRLYAALYH